MEMDIPENITILFVWIANKELCMGCIFALWTGRRQYSLLFHRARKIFVQYFVLSAKYLGMSLDAKLLWKAHIKKKREEMDLR